MSAQPSTMPRRILEAASLLFAEHGYNAVTTRMIAERVGIRHGSVYYHFKTKEALYTEVFRALFETNDILTYDVLLAREPFALDTPGGKAYAIQRIVTDFFHRHLHITEEWKRQLLLRELFHPSPVFLQLVEEILKFESEKMTEFFFLLKPDGSEEEAYLWAHMPDTQSLYYMMAKPAIATYYDGPFVERLGRRLIKTTIRNMIAMLDLPVPEMVK